MFRLAELCFVQLFFFFPITMVCDRYEYLLFENYELNKASFIKEQVMVKNLRVKARILKSEMMELSKCIHRHFSFEMHMIPQLNLRLKCIDFRLKLLFSHLQNKKLSLFRSSTLSFHNPGPKYEKLQNYDYLYNLSVRNIIRGAMKGIIMLQSTYLQDIKHYSKGYLSIKGVLINTSRQIDSLLAQDLAAMSAMAFQYMKLYDSSILYLKAAFDLFYSNSKTEQRIRAPDKLEPTLLGMKKVYLLVDNNLLTQKKINAEFDGELIAYMDHTG